ncbi:MAG: hypothetical protein RLN81_06470 [Balneolaceae bacterium]
MLSDLPIWIPISFSLVTFLTIYLFLAASKWSKTLLAIIVGFMVVQVFLSIQGFYLKIDTIPPRFILMLAPSLILMVIVFSSKRGKSFLEKLDIKMLTLLHIIRIPVEFILWALFLNETIPERMTFEGLNYDILAGLTAPVIYYFYFIQKSISKKWILGWNLLSLALLLNIVINAILSTPSVFQQLAFNQPNIAILHFPFIWLPSIVVPIVMFSHLAAIRFFRRTKL